VSRGGGDTRVIEVKGRGGRGPITIPERQLSTMAAAGVHLWLYVVWNTTQPYPIELWTIADPARLDWVETQAATRTPEEYRGVQHEAKYEISCDVVDRFGTQVSLQPIAAN